VRLKYNPERPGLVDNTSRSRQRNRTLHDLKREDSQCSLILLDVFTGGAQLHLMAPENVPYWERQASRWLFLTLRTSRSCGAYCRRLISGVQVKER
jgi:hypothetical protein